MLNFLFGIQNLSTQVIHVLNIALPHIPGRPILPRSAAGIRDISGDRLEDRVHRRVNQSPPCDTSNNSNPSLPSTSQKHSYVILCANSQPRSNVRSYKFHILHPILHFVLSRNYPGLISKKHLSLSK